jgi:hypothetical protein
MLLHDFRERAEECMSMAQRTDSPRDRDFLLEMARAWCGMAQKWEEVADPSNATTKDKRHGTKIFA